MSDELRRQTLFAAREAESEAQLVLERRRAGLLGDP